MRVLHSGRCNSMKENDIRKYAKLMAELGLTGLEITENNSKVRMERSAAVQPKEMVYPMTDFSVEEPDNEQENYISVKSPTVGVFYAAPAENADPYVAVGDRIEKGQTLCIVEAMKLMNEITAEEDGEIIAICVTNGQVVEYGTELFRIKR